MSWTRRDFLKAGGVTSLALGLNALSPDFFQRTILAAPPSTKKVVLIFQRGGNDGVNTLIPRGDPEYSAENRPTLYIPTANGLDLGNGYAQLNPMMGSMMEIYNHTSLTGVAGPGNLACIHRVGYANHSQSHFDSEVYFENGVPGRADILEGIFYRYLEQTGRLANPENIVATSLSSSRPVSLNGDLPIPAVSNPRTFRFNGPAGRVQKLLGTLPTTTEGTNGKGLLGLYGGPKQAPGKYGRSAVYGTGTVLINTVQTLTSITQAPYTPANGAVYPATSIGDKMRDAAMLLKGIPELQFVAMSQGGYDTHNGQGGQYGSHGNLLQALADSITAFSRDVQSMWQDVVVFTLTEFGRTSIENGNRGTDHAYSSVVFAAGGPVRGGVYNCDASTWAAGDMFSQSGRYVRRRTDFRALYGEIIRKHLGGDQSLVEQVIPGYAAAAAANPADFAPLNFIA